MGRLRFDPEEVRRVWEHSKASKHWRKVWGEERHEPYLCLVHDHGVYLMSPGIPHLEREDKPESSFVAYAAGCNPDKQEFDDWWETSRILVGGDDFSEELPIDTFDKLFALPNVSEIYIDLSESNIEVGCKYREVPVPVKKRKPTTSKKSAKKKKAKSKKRSSAPPVMDW